MIETVLTARSPEECIEAEAALRLWLRSHPDDFEALWAGEQLAEMKDVAFGAPPISIPSAT